MAFRNRISCYVCGNALAPRIMVRLDGEDNNIIRQEISIQRRDQAGRPPMDITQETRICNNCNITILREIQMLEDDPQCMRLNVISQTSSQTCLVCNVRDGLHRLSLECRLDIFVKRNIYIPETYVCCDNHLDDSGLLSEDLMQQLRCINRPYILKGQQLQIFLQGLREEVLEKRDRKFESENNFTDDEFHSLSPITKQQFADLFSFCDPVLEGNRHRKIHRKDLLCLLCKLRQGLSDDFLCVIFRYTSRQATSLAISSVRRSLMTRFVTENVGLQAITRQQYIDRHVNDFANVLYNPLPANRKVIVYNDCTYLEIEKSSCFKALRQSYCLYKSQHLLKPSMLVAPDGYILDIQGPYFSNAANNDARILLNELNRDVAGMRDWFIEGDIFVVDRGYRDAIPTLERLGMNVKMPPLLGPNQSQFSTEQANRARLITKTRWVVEARNGHMKNIFKFFSHLIKTSHIPNLRDFLHISGAIINKYHPLITMEEGNAATAEQMIIQAQEVNIVQARVEVENLMRRRGQWVALSPQHVPLFPPLDLDQVRRITFGTYQVDLSRSYIQDTLWRDEAEDADANDRILEIDLNVNDPGFIRLRIYSRFRNAARYQLWIAYNEEWMPGGQFQGDPILGYYCTCKSGARTLGTCAHIASLLWYLGYARNQNDIRYPSTRLLETALSAQHVNINDVVRIIEAE